MIDIEVLFTYFSSLINIHFQLLGIGLREDWTGDSKISDADKSGKWEYLSLCRHKLPASSGLIGFYGSELLY